jgi:hypothetical protein
MNYQKTVILLTSYTILHNTLLMKFRGNGSEMPVFYIIQPRTYKSCVLTPLISRISSKFHLDLTKNPGVITNILK